MARVFKSDKDKKAIEIIRDTLDVSASGVVTFKCKTGRGCGSGIEIPADEFDTFVEYMLETQKKIPTLVKQQEDGATQSDDVDVEIVIE